MNNVPDQDATMPGYDAFLSYSSADAAVAGRVQRWLEGYKLPGGRRLCVYRDETDIAGGELPAQLRQALADSACLVVCCSPAAARSEWVNREVEAFREVAPGRPILPVLVAAEPPGNLPATLGPETLRWADLRAGWKAGRPRKLTRVELVRVVAGVAGVEFRDLLPLDQRRRRRALLTTASVIGGALFLSAWIPVLDWIDVTPTRNQVFQCDQLEDGIAYFMLNEPYAIKNIVNVTRNVFGGDSAGHGGVVDGAFIPRGRLLPASIATGLAARCQWSGAEWLGEPIAGTCMALRQSETTEFYADPMGGFEAPLTDVIIGAGEPQVIDNMWGHLDEKLWSEYGRSVTPSAGLPVAARGNEFWLGFPQSESLPGSLWRTTDGGAAWERVPAITDVRSIRHTGIGVLAAARLDRELGFYLLRDTTFVPFEVPGKGDDLEVCGEVAGQPVVRADRSAWLRARRPWWRTRLD
jgi:hypothetical protein